MGSDMQPEAMRFLTPLLYLVYSLGVIVIMAGLIYAVTLMLS